MDLTSIYYMGAENGKEPTHELHRQWVGLVNDSDPKYDFHCACVCVCVQCAVYSLQCTVCTRCVHGVCTVFVRCVCTHMHL